jgi:ankyrin repeat protein
VAALPALRCARAQNGRTPLHWAAEGGHPPVVKLLVDSGADVEAKDNVRCAARCALHAGSEHHAAVLLRGCARSGARRR